MLRLLLIFLIALIVYALVDCVRHDDTTMPVGLPKAVWVILIVLFPGAGALAWLVVSRVQRQAQRTGGPARPSYGSPAPRTSPRRPITRPVAPDDDPEFLASLNRPEPEPEERRDGKRSVDPGEDRQDAGEGTDDEPDARR